MSGADLKCQYLKECPIEPPPPDKPRFLSSPREISLEAGASKTVRLPTRVGRERHILYGGIQLD